MKPNNNLIFLFLFSITYILSGCSAAEENKIVEGKVILLDSINAPLIDGGTDSLIEIYRHDLEKEMNEVIAYSAIAMEKDRPEGLLNNFVADLVLEQGRQIFQPGDEQPIDFCLLNYGGLRTSIPEGSVTRSRVFELMPFDNEMVVITLTPEKTWELFQYIAKGRGGVPIAGLTIGIKEQQVSEVKIQGEPFDKTRNYKVLTSDYLSGGGDNMNFFQDPVDMENLGMKIRDAILIHLQQQNEEGKQISSELDNRIYFEN